MTHFPRKPSQRPTGQPSESGRVALSRDVLWGRPLFKAPSLPNSRVIFDPLPFTATRITHRPAQQEG